MEEGEAGEAVKSLDEILREIEDRANATKRCAPEALAHGLMYVALIDVAQDASTIRRLVAALRYAMKCYKNEGGPAIDVSALREEITAILRGED